MFDIQNYASFIATVLVFQLTPGPGTLTILTATARAGIGGGLGAVAGTLLGDFAHMAGAALGLAAVMHAHPRVFAALQWIGAAYLCWLGIRLLRSRAPGVVTATEPKSHGRRYFMQAFAVSITNPMIILFFVAFFPLFLRADASPATLAALMAHVAILSLLYQAGLVLAGNAVARKLSAIPNAGKMAARLAGAALIGFGVQLALSNA